jgi:hypothetical protein
MWRKVPCEQQLDMGESILRDRKIPFESGPSPDGPVYRKGIGLIFPNQEVGMVVTQAKLGTLARALGRVLFSY